MSSATVGDLVVHGGIVVNASGSTPATVLISEGKVRSLLDPGLPLPENARSIDASGSLVIPGGVDPHCHIGQRLGEYAALDDYEQAS